MSFSIIFNNKNYNYNISTSNWESNNAPSMIQSTSTEIIKDETMIFPKLLIPLLDDRRTYNTIDMYEIVPVKS